MSDLSNHELIIVCNIDDLCPSLRALRAMGIQMARDGKRAIWRAKLPLDFVLYVDTTRTITRGTYLHLDPCYYDWRLPEVVLDTIATRGYFWSYPYGRFSGNVAYPTAF